MYPSESLSEKTGRGVRALLKHYPCSVLHMLPQVMQMLVRYAWCIVYCA